MRDRSSDVRAMRRGAVSTAMIVGIGLGLAATAIWLWMGTGSAATPETVFMPPAITVPPIEAPGIEARPRSTATLPPAVAVVPEITPLAPPIEQTMLGQWQRDSSYGKAFLNLQKDGTGTMVMTFGGVYYYAVGPRLDAEITWRVEEGRAIFDMVSGRPQSAFETVVKNKGPRLDQRIVEVADDHMLFLDDRKDNSVARWTRPGFPPSPSGRGPG